MRKPLLLAIAIVGVGGVTTAHAVQRQYWDNQRQIFVSYDSEGMKAGRTYTPIRREVVDYEGPYGAKTIIVNTSERRLYYVLDDGKAVKYGVGVGREGSQGAGTDRISRKAEWPGWTPPPPMRKRLPDLPAYMPGGPDNPLGARALYIGDTFFRIHGTAEPWTIGQAVSSGCIRMVNEDVVDLYDRVSVGTKVVVLR